MVSPAQIVRKHLAVMPMAQRVLGRTGRRVTAFGLGGQALLEVENRQKEAVDLIRKALDLGVTYFDTAAIYGPSRAYLGQALGLRRQTITLASKVYQRGYKEAQKELDESFELLRTPYIDLVQVHGIKDESDLNVFGKNGSLRVLTEARKAGRIGFIGVTGHYDPAILLRFMGVFDFDTVLLPVNPATPQFLPVVAEAGRRGMGVIGMKVMSRGILPRTVPAGSLMQFALNWCHVAIVGCSNESDVERNVMSAAEFRPGIIPEFNLPASLVEEAAFFAKGNESQRWPTTYQPDLPTLQYEKG